MLTSPAIKTAWSDLAARLALPFAAHAAASGTVIHAITSKHRREAFDGGKPQNPVRTPCHPRRLAAERYLLTVDPSKMFRTDRQDKEERPTEWSHDAILGADQDDVNIVIRENGTIDVKYRGSR